MIVVGGESNTKGDMNDIWALDLETMLWFCPPVLGHKNFTPKRFHTATSFDNMTKLVTFGGCHAEYEHLGDLTIFDFSQFLSIANKDP